jgi:hypothetical protein
MSDELIEAGNCLNELIKQAHLILEQYLIPDRKSADETIDDLLTVFDGSKQREVQGELGQGPERGEKLERIS